MRTSRAVMLAAAALALLAVAAGTGRAEDPVKIGFSASKTGLFANASVTQTNGYDLWAEQVNAAGGLSVAGVKRPVQLISYDDQSNPSMAAEIYEKLITSDKVDLLFSPFGTPNHFSVVPILERYKFPMVGSSAASVRLRELKPGNIWFPTSAFPDRMADVIAQLLQAQNYKTAAILTVQLPFSLELKKFLLPALDKAGIKVLTTADYPADIKDMTPTLTAIKEAAPDAVIGLTFPADSVLYMQQAREIGITAPFQMLSVGPTYAFFQNRFGANANGIVMMGQWSPHQKDWPKAKPFFDAYVAKFHERPEYFDSALAYMSAEITAQAVGRAGLDHDKLRQDISIQTFDTINGPVRFQGVENVTTPTMLMQIQDGEAQIVWPKETASAPFKPKGAWAN
ncbi:MAG TPA: amino acid ABC transporter substrate-binding protein [Xanthobacteraceae bacterium]|nr:amino acid ABC transporter substrate-binding protein [Xanthobacteraceae bacterium]